MSSTTDNIDVCNQSNPFHSTTTSALVAILKGDTDPLDAAARELSNRLRDHNGTHVGYKASARIYEDFRGSR